MTVDWEKVYKEFSENNPEISFEDIDLWELDYSGRKRNLLDYLKDGIQLNATISLVNNLPQLYTKFPFDDLYDYQKLYLTPEIERFIIQYLLRGKSTGAPKLYLKKEDIEFRAEDNYIYRHLKREIERNAKFDYKENEQGISVTVRYPYGSITYETLPHNVEELDSILESVESYHYDFPEYDIQALHSNDLPKDELPITKGAKLKSVFKNGIPTNVILDKTICGIGATYLEIETKRNSIIIEPNVPVIIGKERDHPQIIGVYGEDINDQELREQIAERIESKKYIKILTTPDSFPRVTTALKSLRIPYRTDYFLLFDECDKIIEDIDFRRKISLPIDEFFLFKNKAMVSATPIIIDEPRFKEQDFSIIKIKPDFKYAKKIELKPTNNINLMLKRTIETLTTHEENLKLCIFFNYVKGITDIIDYLKIPIKDASIYCSEKACKELKKEGWEKNVYSNLQYEDKTVNLTTKYNFFTSRYHSAVDINLDCKPIVIMLSTVYKSIPNETPFTLIEPATEAIQIAGRFRNGISRLIHIANTNPEIEWKSKEDLKTFLDEQHNGYLKMRELEKTLSTDGEKYIIRQGIIKTDYYQQGFVNNNNEKNYFRYNNAYLDERLKMIYSNPTMLNKAYSESGAFQLYSESTYCAYSEQELSEIKSKNTSKAKKVKILYEIYTRLTSFKKFYYQEIVEELKKDFSLYLDAFNSIGYQRVKELGFTDSKIKTEIKAFQLKKQLTTNEIRQDVYDIFKEGEKYTIASINNELERIFNKHNIDLGRRIKAADIEHYFEIKECRTGGVRWYELLTKQID